MRTVSRLLCSIILAAVSFASIGCGCTYPKITNFGAQDAFAAVPVDPAPYNPAFPQFVTFLNGQGIATANMATFDNLASNRHMVATLRHGLRGCFAGASSLTLCFGARSVSADSTNDGVVIYDTNFTNNTFPVIHNSTIAPALSPTWTQGSNATLCIDLTAQMLAGTIGDMLQFRVQDDTAVDFITMELQ
jgi:hypothetical protein